ncbi:sensor histidine kinase [Citreimonas salinaria]|uniref:C4-dicarboxylate transport sensor protein DctB n=1 Tax=Citreimonas salinaria TaxID=321339 RepID=A0A1H3EVW2_9RHOB|nr:ATP-binding protein [Citreimonas salinaria]SDX82760.1 two-component system, NtrC family, C4-dicarboxylate transport sensor histidine kinase DctB [Citreimonas salinaria]
MRAPTSRSLFRKPLPGLILAAMLGTGALVAWPALERHFLIRAAMRDEATLRLVTEVLRGALSRTEALPALIAERPILARVLRAPDATGLIPFANEQLRLTALSLDVSDIYLMDRQGDTLAASSYRAERSFIGQNFAYRPYFTDAIGTGVGRFHALGTTSGERGYYFAAPVLDGTEILGAVAVKITLDQFEDAWAQSDSTVAVYDTSNVVFLSDRADWRFRSIGPVSELAIERIAQTRQYPLDAVSALPLRRVPLADGLTRATLDGDGGRESFVLQEGLIAAAGWRVAVLTPAGPATAQAAAALALAGLIVLLGALVAAFFGQRRARLLERLEAQRSQHALLESRVRDRTRDLDDANRRLRAEVEERRAAEARLRRTQAELVQAGKLAALGQMSAALSHEFNQPLGAVKSYAENALTFLDRGRMAEARDNVGRISRMADRMATISQHLRNFARRPKDHVGPVPLRAVVEDAVEIMQARLARSGVTLRGPDWPDAPVWAMGGRVRLQQVLVNLLANALDAMADDPAPAINLVLEATEDTLALRVRDHGPGLGDGDLPQVFDPFFTTKDPGRGLGLGLSISYNIVRDFGGTLTAANAEGGGAVFTVTLRRAAPQAQETAAE